MPPADLLADLPPLRDDEPSSLRQDIADELADHLGCAFHRELVRTGDAEVARQRVLDRFGDPVQLARKLWFQAMWSRIMSQRIMLACSVTMAIASLAAVGLVGWMSQQQQMAAAEQQRALLNVLERLTTSSDNQGPTPPNSPVRDMVALTVRTTVAGTPDQPLSGVNVDVQPEPMVQGTFGYNETTDGNGVADFAYVRIGRYRYSISTPWGEFASGRFTVHPTDAHVEKIKVPGEPPEPGSLTLESGIPEALRSRGVTLTASIVLQSRKIGDTDWYPRWNVSTGFRGAASIHGSRLRGCRVALLSDGGCWIASNAEPVSAVGSSGGFFGGGGGFGGGFPSIPAEVVAVGLSSSLTCQFFENTAKSLVAWKPAEQLELPSGEYAIQWTVFSQEPVPMDASLRDEFLSALSEHALSERNWDGPALERKTFQLPSKSQLSLAIVPPANMVEHILSEMSQPAVKLDQIPEAPLDSGVAPRSDLINKTNPKPADPDHSAKGSD